MEIWLFGSAILVLILLLDDALVDFLSLTLRLKPQTQYHSQVHDHDRTDPIRFVYKPVKRPLAIIVANWRESNIIRAMVTANAPLLTDPLVHLFLGVYPNDEETVSVARQLAEEWTQVHIVVNGLEGPTYKGQMLDQIITGVCKIEEELDFQFSGFLIHDSEDLIDPRSIDVYRTTLQNCDFVQIPVLSLPLRLRSWVGGTYMDEFAESHSKDLLVRQRLGAAIPSAGVGTCLRRNLVMALRQQQGGQLFPHKDLTEDYALGQRAFQLGFRSQFICTYGSPNSPHQLVATREYFPNTLRAAIRQKSRWNLGIAFQGWQQLGWFGSFWQRYFLWRDRKSILVPFVCANSLFAFASLLFLKLPSPNSLFLTLILIQMALVSTRLLLRMYWVWTHHGIFSAVTVPLRWPLATLINTCAGVVAFVDFFKIRFLDGEIIWKKTEHQFLDMEGTHARPPGREVVL